MKLVQTNECIMIKKSCVEDYQTWTLHVFVE